MDWLRLWHDMPNDPKWRTIARLSGEPVALVMAIYVHLLVDASRNVTRGHVTVTPEDLASALDVTETQIQAVVNSMEGRVIENGSLLGWEKRQPKREDSGNEKTGAKSAAQRKKEQRERDRLATSQAQPSQTVTTSHEESRNVTTDEIRLDTEKIRGIGIPTFVAEEEEVFSAQNASATKAVWVCKLMKSVGVADVNPSNQTLLTLLEAGATQHEFRAAAVKAVAMTKGFKYALAIVSGERADAAETAKSLHRGPMPQAESFRERDDRIAAERMAEFAPGVARKTGLSAVPSVPQFDPKTIDAEVIHVAAIADR